MQTETNPAYCFLIEVWKAGIITHPSRLSTKNPERMEKESGGRSVDLPILCNQRKSWFCFLYHTQWEREREREPVEEKGSGEEDEGGKGVGVEDEDQVAHSPCHGLFAHYHKPNLCTLCHHHAHKRKRNTPHPRSLLSLFVWLRKVQTSECESEFQSPRANQRQRITVRREFGYFSQPSRLLSLNQKKQKKNKKSKLILPFIVSHFLPLSPQFFICRLPHFACNWIWWPIGQWTKHKPLLLQMLIWECIFKK